MSKDTTNYNNDVYNDNSNNRFIQNNKINSDNKNVGVKNNSTNSEILKKNINKQALKNPNKTNSVKPHSDSEKNTHNRMSLNQSKNTINRIHQNNNSDNRNDINDDNTNTNSSLFQKLSNGFKNSFDKKFEILKKVEGFDTSFNTSSILSKGVKLKILVACVPIFVVLVVVVSVIAASGGDSSSSNEKNDKMFMYASGKMDDMEFYEYLISENLADGSCINNDDETLSSDCPALDFYKTLFDKIGGMSSNEDKKIFFTIYYAISYNRKPVDYYSLVDTDEFNSLIANKNNLKEYLNNDYIKNYRSDINPEFDLYEYVTGMFDLGEQSNSISNKYYACSSIVVDGMDHAISLEDYISGVTYSEFNSSSSADAWKAFSVMLRTYIVKSTSNCKKQFEPGDLVYSEGSTDDMKNAINEKSGIILVTEDDTAGNVDYEEFCYNCNDNSEIYDEKTYEDIISNFYPDYKQISMTSSFGGPINGAYTDLFYYTSFPVHKPYDDSSNGLKNIEYYNQTYGSSTYQCPWWVKARALEMLNTINVQDEEARKKVIGYINSSMGNGNQWYSLNSLKDLPHSQDSSQARPGTIVSWTWENPCNHKTFIIKDKDGNVIDCPNYGHVGIIENVTYKADGTIDTIYVSESGGDLGIHVNKYTVDSIKKGWAGVNGDYTFLGYVYLLN